MKGKVVLLQTGELSIANGNQCEPEVHDEERGGVQMIINRLQI